MRVAPKVVLSSEDEEPLRKFARGRSTPVRLAQRSKIVLLAAKGLENREIATQLNIDRETVGRWRRRYVASGLPGIEKDAQDPRSGTGGTRRFGACGRHARVPVRGETRHRGS